MGIRGKTIGNTRATQQRRTDFVVWTCPADAELAVPLYNPGARFNQLDIAGMLYDGGVPDGTTFRREVGDEWLAYQQQLHELDDGRLTGRALRVKEASHGHPLFEEVRG